MAIASDLLELVPIGEENAAPGLLLWKLLNMWSPATIKHNLQQMADKGVIERKRVRRGPHETNLYFRSRKIEQLPSVMRDPKTPAGLREQVAPGHGAACLREIENRLVEDRELHSTVGGPEGF